jgi:3-carboxy-cis,cis-muconate cycloisomerase
MASLGGPVGTLADLGDKATAVAEAFAAELHLAAPAVAWHARRARLVRLAGWLATLIGALAKMATDVVHLSSTEVAEVAEAPAPGRGGSSAMPHKQNPLSATVILAAHAVAPGHAAAMIAGMAAAGQRPAGAWHGEWHALPALFGLASGALREARRIGEALVVDAARMQTNLDAGRGLQFSGAATDVLAGKLGRAEARRLVATAAATARRSGRELRDVLAEDPGVPRGSAASVAAAFDIMPAVAAAAAATDRAVAEAEAIMAMITPQAKRR